MQIDWRSLWRKDGLITNAAALSSFHRVHRAVLVGSSQLTQDADLLMLYSTLCNLPAASVRPERTRVTKAVSILRERFSEELSLSELAALVDLTPWHFCRTFKQSVGLSPHAYQNSLRAARAQTLFAQGQSAGEVAYEVGFYDQSHLSLHFKRFFGKPPLQFLETAISSYTDFLSTP